MSAPSRSPKARQWRDYEFMFGGAHATSFRMGGTAIGAVAAVLIVIPFVGATFLERSAGDATTVAVLAVVGVLALAGAVLLYLKRFLILALLLVNLAFWCGVAVSITLRMDW